MVTENAANLTIIMAKYQRYIYYLHELNIVTKTLNFTPPVVVDDSRSRTINYFKARPVRHSSH